MRLTSTLHYNIKFRYTTLIKKIWFYLFIIYIITTSSRVWYLNASLKYSSSLVRLVNFSLYILYNILIKFLIPLRRI